MNTLADRILLMRNELELTQQQLANMAGLKQSDISKLERGDSKKTTEMVGLSRALRCNPYWLDNGRGDPHSPPGWPFELFNRSDFLRVDAAYRKRIENELAGEIQRLKKPSGTNHGP